MGNLGRYGTCVLSLALAACQVRIEGDPIGSLGDALGTPSIVVAGQGAGTLPVPAVPSPRVPSVQAAPPVAPTPGTAGPPEVDSAPSADEAGAPTTPFAAAPTDMVPGRAPVIPEVDGECPVFASGEITLGGVAGIQIVAGPRAATATAPMVFYWHGTRSAALEYRELAAPIRQAVEAEGGILVALDESSGRGSGACSITGTFLSGDMEIVDQLVACAVRDHNIDPRRIFTTGCSAGGLFAACLAAERSEYIAATAPNSGGVVQPLRFSTDYTPALMTMHGPPGVDVAFFDFSHASATANAVFKNRGAHVVTCAHGGNHCMAAPLATSVWSFFAAHPYGTDPSPWQNGTPAELHPDCSNY